MKEIGSEFWDVPISMKQHFLFPHSTQWFISGRSALQAIVRELKGCHTVAIPSWCCDSMVKPFINEGFDIHFYPVYWRDKLIQEICLDYDVLFVMDYFGYTSFPMQLSGYKGVVIRDVTHSLFSKTYNDSDYYFGSLRKWCGIWTGGYAWTKDSHTLQLEDYDDHGYIRLRESAMLLKEKYIVEEEASDKKYLDLFERAEGLLDSIGVVPAAERDINLTNVLDEEFIRTRRRQNAEILRKAFPELLMFHQMNSFDCPMFVPILVPDGKRDALHRYLIQNNVYCPIHWPLSQYQVQNSSTNYIYTNELSLVCDQRYTEDDMYKVVETVNKFMKEV